MSGWDKFKETDTLELITYFQDENISIELRDEAFLAIAFRFREAIVKRCVKICLSRGYDKDVAIQITENTFKKYAKSKGFKVSKQRTSKTDECFVFYLSRIARNELNDYYRQEQKRQKNQLYNGTERIVTALPTVNMKNLSLKQKLIHKTIMDLPKEERVVFLTYTAHEKDGVNLPRKLQQQLREYLGVDSQSTIRSYKQKALKKINSIETVLETLEEIS